jgi:hypothetical protein
MQVHKNKNNYREEEEIKRNKRKKKILHASFQLVESSHKVVEGNVVAIMHNKTVSDYSHLIKDLQEDWKQLFSRGFV